MDKYILLFLISLSLNITSIFAQQKMETFSYSGEKLSYTILLPLDFDTTKTYPVMVGPSEIKSASSQSFYWQGTTDSQGWILVNFEIYEGTDALNEIKGLLNHLKSKYNVEGNKFHTVCYSANSASIFDLVMEIPDYFVAITGMAGNPNNGKKEKMKQLKDVKVQFIVGDKDTYWMRSAKKSHSLLLDLGVESSIEIIKNGQHIMKPLIGKGFLDRASRLRK